MKLIFSVMMLFPVAAFAQEAGPEAPGIGSMLLPFVLIFAIFYFMLIRPQVKRQKEHVALVESLSKGDIVISNGGIQGKVVKNDATNGMMEVEIAKGVTVQMEAASVARLKERKGGKPANDK